ncbi:MAG: GTP-dependent dephospho-CoA kinase family protein [Candidatus Methanofastidiosia archaeon]
MKLTKEAEEILKKPQGFLIKGDIPKPYLKFKEMYQGEKIIAVGDVVVENLKKLGMRPFITIVDGKTKRRLKKDLGEYDCVVKNPKSHITKELLKVLREKRAKRILVDGEEDLAALPAILYADLDTIVVYGQPDEGIVVVRVSDKAKRKAREILKLFKVDENGDRDF